MSTAKSSVLSGAEFVYSGADCNIVYRFLPATGTLNDLQVVYNDDFQFSPANYGGITSFVLAGQVLRPWEQRHTSQLLEEKNVGGIYTAKFRWSYNGDELDFSIRFFLRNKTLVIDFQSYSDKVVEFGLDRSELTPDPKVVELPYGHHVLFTNNIFVSAVIDPDVSNASTIAPMNYLYSNQSAYYSYATSYQALTSGYRNPLHERIYLTVSPEITETFYRVPNPVSPYRQQLVNKVVVDLWRSFPQYQSDLQVLSSLGMKDLFVILHVWQKYGYDNGFPTTYPAGQEFGGEIELMKVMQLCAGNQYLCALHTNYVDFYPNSDVWNPADVALNPDGSWVEAWFNSYTGIQSYLMKPSRILEYAKLYEPQIHAAYRTNAGYLDVHSAILPSDKVDYDARVLDTGKQSVTYDAYKRLISYVRSVHEGPVAGEGFGFSTSLWAGYIDATEADPRSIPDMISNRGGSDVPTIVDYKLQVLHELFVPHGVGYLERFYLDKQNGFTVDELDRYRTTELAFGQAGFLSNLLARGVSVQQIKREYCLTKHVQQYYLSASPVEILYNVGGQYITLTQALRNILPGVPNATLKDTLSEELGIVKIRYSNGLTLYVNRTKTRSIELVDGIRYTLRPNDFYAKKMNEFLAYSAEITGVSVDYICPAEDGCSTCGPTSIFLPIIQKRR